MKGQKPPTEADKARFRILVDIGCICCETRGIYSAPEIHHLTTGFRRIGHHATIPLCAWCHRGVPPFGLSQREARRVFGPSLAHSLRAFESEYGTEMGLLQKVNARIRRIERGRLRQYRSP